STNDENMVRPNSFGLRYSDFLRHLSFFSRSAHLGNFRQTQNLIENVLSRRVLDLVDSDRIGDVEAAGFRSTQRFQMRTAAKRFTDLVNIGPDIKAFAAQHTEIDFGQVGPVDCVAIDLDEAWLALHHFSLSR